MAILKNRDGGTGEEGGALFFAIRLRMTPRINVGYLSLTSKMNGGNIRLLMTLK